MVKLNNNILNLLLGIFFSLFLIWLTFLIEPIISGQPYNQTGLVNTSVNITNAAPLVFNVATPSPINLIAYDNLTVDCNFTVYDYDNNTVDANATFHLSSVSSKSTPDQNTLYTNSSCTRLGPIDFYTNYTCTFSLRYFANNGTWYCNATGIDSLNGVGTNISATSATINPLVAIKMGSSLLDFGQVGVNGFSNDTIASITNAGNRNANISVKGYGNTEGDGLAMICDSGNIAVGNERYDVYNGTAFGLMNPLTANSAMIRNFYIQQRTSESTDSFNSTYWKLTIPTGAAGICNGKILFTASDRGN